MFVSMRGMGRFARAHLDRGMSPRQLGDSLAARRPAAQAEPIGPFAPRADRAAALFRRGLRR